MSNGVAPAYDGSPVGADGRETLIESWRAYVSRRSALSTADVDELEGHLRDRIEALVDSGLSDDEAFLIAVKRIGSLDAISLEFAREHSDRLWKQLVIGESSPSAPKAQSLMVAVVAALAAALFVKLPAIFGFGGANTDEFLIPSAPVLFLLPLAAYLLVRRRAGAWTWVGALAPFVGIAVLLTAYPFEQFGMTHLLAILHSVVVLWLAVGVAYASGDVWSGPARMNFLRFTGEWAVYVLLILLGGVALAALAGGVFSMVGIDLFEFIRSWLAPCGTAAAFVVGAWLVEEKKNVIENIVPVLARLFTPLFAVVLIAFVGSAVVQRGLVDDSRELLIVFDAVLIATVALLLYSMSARETEKPPSWFEGLQLTMIAAALVVDVIVLAAMLGRIGEYGASANKLASLGINLIMLANLSGAAWLLLRFMRGRTRFAVLERWQTSFAPVYLVWAAIVVVVFPPAFGFV